MARYIDADKMINGYSTTFPYNLDYCDDGDLMEWIESQPTADVVEVRHGEWIYVDSDLGWREYECSVCHTHCVFDVGEKSHNFCGHCGARMDGE